MNYRSTAIGLSVALCALLAAGCLPTPPEGQSVQLHFYSEDDLRNASFDHPVVATREISASDDAMDAALRLLFAGPTEEEEGRGARTSGDLTRLGPLYLGMWTDGAVVIVNFRREALEILNSAAARQLMAKEPIRRTLLQFPAIEDVQYAIDGEIFEEWDA